MARTEAPSETWPADMQEALGFCPVCGGGEREVLHEGLRDRLGTGTPGRWTLRGCGDCGAGYLDPRPAARGIHLAYTDYYTHEPAGARTAGDGGAGGWRHAIRNDYLNAKYGYDLRPALPLARWVISAKRRLKADRTIRHLGRPARETPRVLDLGCGNGAFLLEMRRLGWAGFGLEPDESAVEAARRAGLDVRQGVLTEAIFPPEHFDAVTMNHVIEHVHDPASVLRTCLRILRPGGTLWIATPNLVSLGHRWYGTDWRGLEPPRHLVLFTPGALARALGTAGFDVSPGLVRGVGARWMLRTSETIRRGREDRVTGKPAFIDRRRLRRRAGRADRLARRRPELAEEIVMIARKPAA
jgi:SAM-dependent methyltransferase